MFCDYLVVVLCVLYIQNGPKHDSEKKVVFCFLWVKKLSQLDFSILDFIAGFDLLSKAIYRLFADYWATYAKKNTVII